MKANRTSIGHASIAFLLSDSNLVAEDLDYDPQAKQFLVTSVREKKIISIVKGVIHDFAKAPENWPMVWISGSAPIPTLNGERARAVFCSSHGNHISPQLPNYRRGFA